MKPLRQIIIEAFGFGKKWHSQTFYRGHAYGQEKASNRLGSSEYDAAYITPNREYANRYTQSGQNDSHEGGHVYPLHLRKGPIFDIRKRSHRAQLRRQIAKDNEGKELRYQTNPSEVKWAHQGAKAGEENYESMQALHSHIERLGYIGAHGLEANGEHAIAVFKPEENLKSAFSKHSAAEMARNYLRKSFKG